MSKKITISVSLKEGTVLNIADYSNLAHEGEAIVEVHCYFDVLNKYDIFYYPEHFENAQNALNGGDAWICKTVYHMPNIEETN